MVRISTATATPRLRYVLDFVFGTFLGVAYRIGEVDDENNPDNGVIYYGCEASAPAQQPSLTVPACGLLEEIGAQISLPNWALWNDLPVLFPQEGSPDMPFDIFAAVFYCLSRQEEYATEERDTHGRFISSQSILKPYLERPLLDEWLLAFEKILVNCGMLRKAAHRNLRWINTMDVDIAYAYRGRGLKRSFGAIGKDLLGKHWGRTRERMCVFCGLNEDPYDTYAIFTDAGHQAKEVLFFILCGKRSGYDINLKLKSIAMRKLVALLDEKGRVGIHPSYASHQGEEVLRREVALLSETLGREVVESRQHFLKFSLPETFKQLAAAGILRDYSMGYADAVGYRSGTAYPHLFYDLHAEACTHLELHPLIAMDSALKHYMKLSPEEALSKLKDLWNNALPTGGNFVTVWHNHSLSDREEWKGWREVYITFANFAGQIL